MFDNTGRQKEMKEVSKTAQITANPSILWRISPRASSICPRSYHFEVHRSVGVLLPSRRSGESVGVMLKSRGGERENVERGSPFVECQEKNAPISKPRSCGSVLCIPPFQHDFARNS